MLNIIRHIYSLSAFKRNTSEFINQMKQTRQPVVLMMEAIVGIKGELEDIEAGQIRPVEEFEKEMLQKYGISS